jgi:hypothetical protein
VAIQVSGPADDVVALTDALPIPGLGSCRSMLTSYEPSSRCSSTAPWAHLPADFLQAFVADRASRRAVDQSDASRPRPQREPDGDPRSGAECASDHHVSRPGNSQRSYSDGGNLTTRTIGGIEALKAAMTGAVVRPDDLDYERARKVWKAAINHHPAVIVRCATAQDAAQAIRFAQNQVLELAVRSGAHSAPGYSSVDGGLVIDLSRMNQVTVDPEAKRARVQGGALLRDLDAATQRYGLAVPAGLVSHTGVADFTLGGGMGWLTRQAGLSIDNLVSAEVVVADGKILRAAEDENPDLFWAIRGGGGNFGVVTELEFRLHDVDPVVQFGLLFWDAREGEQALRLMRDTIADLPRILNAMPAALTAPPAPLVPPEHHTTTRTTSSIAT